MSTKCQSMITKARSIKIPVFLQPFLIGVCVFLGAGFMNYIIMIMNYHTCSRSIFWAITFGASPACRTLTKLSLLFTDVQTNILLGAVAVCVSAFEKWGRKKMSD